jgi:hypothetical protein
MILLNPRQSSHQSIFNSLNVFFNEYLYSQNSGRQHYYFHFTEDKIKVYTSGPMVIILELVIADTITINNYHLSSVIIDGLISFLISELSLTRALS